MNTAVNNLFNNIIEKRPGGDDSFSGAKDQSSAALRPATANRSKTAFQDRDGSKERRTVNMKMMSSKASGGCEMLTTEQSIVTIGVMPKMIDKIDFYAQYEKPSTTS